MFTRVPWYNRAALLQASRHSKKTPLPHLHCGSIAAPLLLLLVLIC